MKPIRVRIAPSPTGYLHIGNLRAALFNWVFARQHKGSFLVRIEDTDLVRSKDEYTQEMIKDLAWCSLFSDEHILYQSQRQDLYSSLIKQLVATNHAYWSDASQEDNGISVVRFRIPKDIPIITFHDVVHGDLSIATAEIDDFVIARADGSALYNFCVVVDDHDMAISHVIRGDDHISNTFRQVLLYQAFGWDVPTFAHLPLITGTDGKPLSKRDAATSVRDYRRLGYLPEALCNYLIRLGWAYGDQEIFSRDELVEYFSLDNVHASSAQFDLQKLQWMNGIYLRKLEKRELITRFEEWIGNALTSDFPEYPTENLYDLVVAYQERATTFRDLYESVACVLRAPEYNLSELLQEFTVERSILIARLEAICAGLENLTDWSDDSIKEMITNLTKALSCKMPDLGKPLRIALLGTPNSPSIFTIVRVLGKEKCLQRISHFCKLLLQ